MKEQKKESFSKGGIGFGLFGAFSKPTVKLYQPGKIFYINGTAYQPKTELGQRLLSIRERIVASGQPLKTAEQIEQELAEQSHQNPNAE